MPRYKPYDYRQSWMVSIAPEDQFLEGSLEYALHHLIEERIDDSWFDALYANDETGRPAYSPKLLLKVILLAYSRGIIGSRRIERACADNLTFMALCCGIRPDHSTLASFIGRLDGRMEKIFAEVLMVCHAEGLLSGTHLSIDGLKLPSNASREWSGTFHDLRLKAGKIERKLKEKLTEHRRQDRLDRQHPERTVPPERDPKKERQNRLAAIERLRQKAARIHTFLETEEPKAGAHGNEIQSNITDNDSAKMQTGHGVIEGYNAQAIVDGKNQIILHGLPSGSGQDHRQIEAVLEGTQAMLVLAGINAALPLEKAVLTADCNYHSETNLAACEHYGVDAYIPDNHFRSRDPRFATQERHRARHRQEGARLEVKKIQVQLSDFHHDPASDTYQCPQGKNLTLQSSGHRTGDGLTYRRYRSKARDCEGCPLKAKCIARGGQRKSLAIPVGNQPGTRTARMRQKIDTLEARKLYARRSSIVEPVFGNIRFNKKLDHFTYRGLKKVSVQWSLYCLVHNIEKLAHFGKKYGA